MINGKQLKAVKDILNFLNQEWAPPVSGVLSEKREGGNLVQFKAKMDPYFTAYLTASDIWWICVSDFWVWRDSYDVMKELTDYVDFKIIPCHIHVIQTKMFKDQAKERKNIKLFIGTVSWA